MEQALAGAVSGIFSSAVVYPLDTVKTRIQIHDESQPPTTPSITREGAPTQIELPGKSYKKMGMRTMLIKILKEQGFGALYRGFGAAMVNTFSTQFAYFYWYSIVRKTYIKRFAKGASALNTLTELALGAIAAAFAQLFTIPVAVIATRQQLSNRPLTFKQTLATILADDGITGLWRGLKPSLVLCINPAITYGLFERIKTVVLRGDKMTPGKAFFIGASSKTLATIVTYPYIMAKTRLQAKYDEDELETLSVGDFENGKAVEKKKKEKYSGAIDCLRVVYRENGITGWYQGMQAQIIKAVLAQALLFGIKDALEGHVIEAVRSVQKMKA